MTEISDVLFFFVPGMAHRDLKPENILCEHADKVNLLQGYESEWFKGHVHW